MPLPLHWLVGWHAFSRATHLHTKRTCRAPQLLQIFRGRVGSMRKALKGRAEFVFCDAPFPVEPQHADAQAVAESGGAAGALGRSWW